MKNPLANISMRVIAMIVGVILLIVVVGLFVKSCDNRRSRAAQSRVERSQAEAASNSAADAINTVTGVGTNQAASEDLGRTNERDIRAAEGASTKIGAGVNAAGRSALCKRQAYRDDPKCKGAR
jgi:uncharacterized protein (UPF0333 family)